MFVEKINQKILILLIGLMPVISFAQFTISGNVKDGGSDEYLPGATIQLNDG